MSMIEYLRGFRKEHDEATKDKRLLLNKIFVEEEEEEEQN